MKFASREFGLKRMPSCKQSGVFGVKIDVVTKWVCRASTNQWVNSFALVFELDSTTLIKTNNSLPLIVPSGVLYMMWWSVTRPPGGSAPKFPSLCDSVWRRLSDGGWRRWDCTECPESCLRSWSWRLRLTPVRFSLYQQGSSHAAAFVLYYFTDHCLLCRQQGRVCHDEGDGRERHHRNTEAVFPWAAGASCDWRGVPKLNYNDGSVASSYLQLQAMMAARPHLFFFPPCRSLWRRRQGETHHWPAAVSTGAQSGDRPLPAPTPQKVQEPQTSSFSKKTTHSCWELKVDDWISSLT